MICPSDPPDPTEHEEAPPEEPGEWGEPQAADPCDMGRLLKGALAASGLRIARVARLTGIAPSNLSRALGDPNARPATVRRILRACGLRLALAPQEKSGQEKDIACDATRV